jgi:DNA-binding transcriptional MerR regulator
MQPREYSVAAIARLFKVSGDTIRRYSNQGVFTARRVLGQRVLTDADIEAIRKHRKGIKPGRPRVAQSDR